MSFSSCRYASFTEDAFHSGQVYYQSWSYRLLLLMLELETFLLWYTRTGSKWCKVEQFIPKVVAGRGRGINWKDDANVMESSFVLPYQLRSFQSFRYRKKLCHQTSSALFMGAVAFEYNVMQSNRCGVKESDQTCWFTFDGVLQFSHREFLRLSDQHRSHRPSWPQGENICLCGASQITRNS